MLSNLPCDVIKRWWALSLIIGREDSLWQEPFEHTLDAGAIGRGVVVAAKSTSLDHDQCRIYIHTKSLAAGRVAWWVCNAARRSNNDSPLRKQGSLWCTHNKHYEAGGKNSERGESKIVAGRARTEPQQIALGRRLQAITLYQQLHSRINCKRSL